MKFIKWIKAQGGSRLLAPKIGIGWQAINCWVRGDSSPRPEMMHKLVTMGKGKFDYADIIKDTKKRG